jgi:hypothetical protein
MASTTQALSGVADSSIEAVSAGGLSPSLRTFRWSVNDPPPPPNPTRRQKIYAFLYEFNRY